MFHKNRKEINNHLKKYLDLVFLTQNQIKSDPELILRKLAFCDHYGKMDGKNNLI